MLACPARIQHRASSMEGFNAIRSRAQALRNSASRKIDGNQFVDVLEPVNDMIQIASLARTGSAGVSFTIS